MSLASFFSGIGGLELGLEWAGLGPVVFQCEREPFARDVLERHWPGVARHDDLTTLEAQDIPDADVWCGGPPCQDLSDAGTRWKRPGLEGSRSGLAWAWIRLIEARRPARLVWENVDGAAFQRWVPIVRRTLWDRRYASLPLRLRACDVGGRFEGSRVFILAASTETYGHGQPTLAIDDETPRVPRAGGAYRPDWRQPPSEALGMADGIPARLDRLRAYGNAVVPQCAEVAGYVLLEVFGDFRSRQGAGAPIEQ